MYDNRKFCHNRKYWVCFILKCDPFASHWCAFRHFAGKLLCLRFVYFIVYAMVSYLKSCKVNILMFMRFRTSFTYFDVYIYKLDWEFAKTFVTQICCIVCKVNWKNIYKNIPSTYCIMAPQKNCCC